MWSILVSVLAQGGGGGQGREWLWRGMESTQHRND